MFRFALKVGRADVWRSDSAGTRVVRSVEEKDGWPAGDSLVGGGGGGGG